MRKVLMIVFAALALAGCDKVTMTEENGENGDDPVPEIVGKTKKFTFYLKGDFSAPTFSRGSLQADGKSLTDLWVFDYVDGKCVQQLHQTAEDADWGKPKMSLSMGEHSIYFVASRGDKPVVDTDNHHITWSAVKDTFWKKYDVDVKSTSNGNRSVTLDRVVTKFKVTIDDEIIKGCKQISIIPEVWYYGIDYTDGTPAANDNKPITINIPSNYIGTKGTLSVNAFSISGPKEWSTDMEIKATDENSEALGDVNIKNVPLLRNRSTEYSGNLFTTAEQDDISLSLDWDDPVIGTW
jgi:hypothetical protein